MNFSMVQNVTSNSMVSMTSVAMAVTPVTLGVLDVSDVALVPIDVVMDGLDTPIGQVDEVLAAGVLAVPLLAVAKVRGAVVPLPVAVDLVPVLVVDRVIMTTVSTVAVAVSIAVIRLGEGKGGYRDEEEGDEVLVG